jgi:CubicO group peptidase (beta-lactamase class C family)
MPNRPSRRSILSATAAIGLLAPLTQLSPLTKAFARSGAPDADAMRSVLDYAKSQHTTGFLIIQDRRTLVEQNWPLPPFAEPLRATMTYGTTADGALLEDVASQQKSFVSVLAAVAIDKGLLDVARSVSSYIGADWTKASPDQEAKIRVIDVLTMSSGLSTKFAYAAAPGTVFLYNTPVYAVTKRILTAAAKLPLETVMRDWLTGPAGMSDTSWRKRPAIMASIDNPTGLVTSPRDTARLGQIVLDGGKAADGRRILSEASLEAMFARSTTNPAYGRLWWLNGSPFTVKPLASRVDGPLIPAAPADLVAALGALGRKLYVVPSRNLVVVRMGRSPPDKDFDQQLWLRLARAIG